MTFLKFYSAILIFISCCVVFRDLITLTEVKARKKAGLALILYLPIVVFLYLLIFHAKIVWN